MLKHIFSLGMFVWALVLSMIGYGIGALFGHPILGASIGLGLLVVGILIVVIMGILFVEGIVYFFESISGKK